MEAQYDCWKVILSHVVASEVGEFCSCLDYN